MLNYKPEDIFTPRDHKVNDSMYVNRPLHEQKLKQALKGNRHFTINGESGNGKTWLYKRFFQQAKIHYKVVNLASASKLGSIEAAIADKINMSAGDNFRATETVYEGNASVAPMGLGVSGKKATKFLKVPQSAFYTMLSSMRGRIGSPSVLVFDNFERITDDQDLIEEMANLLILLDDDDFAEFNVRICIVGVPSALKEYFGKLKYAQTIASRLIELPEVDRMKLEEAKSVLTKGFNQLRLRMHLNSPLDETLTRLIYITDRTATALHEIGLEVSQLAKLNENVVEKLIIDDAIENWLASRHSSDIAVVEQVMSPADTGFGRRNQILFCLGLIDTEEFISNDLKSLIRENFSDHSSWIDHSFDDLFSAMTSGFGPLIKRGMQGNTFKIAQSSYRMIIRSLLLKDKDGSVFKIGKKL